jgi:hypothetical protein
LYYGEEVITFHGPFEQPTPKANDDNDKDDDDDEVENGLGWGQSWWAGSDGGGHSVGDVSDNDDDDDDDDDEKGNAGSRKFEENANERDEIDDDGEDVDEKEDVDEDSIFNNNNPMTRRQLRALALSQAWKVAGSLRRFVDRHTASKVVNQDKPENDSSSGGPALILVLCDDHADINGNGHGDGHTDDVCQAQVSAIQATLSHRSQPTSVVAVEHAGADLMLDLPTAQLFQRASVVVGGGGGGEGGSGLSLHGNGGSSSSLSTHPDPAPIASASASSASSSASKSHDGLLLALHGATGGNPAATPRAAAAAGSWSSSSFFPSRGSSSSSSSLFSWFDDGSNGIGGDSSPSSSSMGSLDEELVAQERTEILEASLAHAKAPKVVYWHHDDDDDDDDGFGDDEEHEEHGKKKRSSSANSQQQHQKRKQQLPLVIRFLTAAGLDCWPVLVSSSPPCELSSAPLKTVLP